MKNTSTAAKFDGENKPAWRYVQFIAHACCEIEINLPVDYAQELILISKRDTQNTQDEKYHHHRFVSNDRDDWTGSDDTCMTTA